MASRGYSILSSTRSLGRYTYVKLRLNSALKNECQFHVKSLILPFSSLKCETVRFLFWPNQGLIFTYRIGQAHISTCYMNWTWRLKKISRMLMQSLKQKKGVPEWTLLYNIKRWIYICIYTSRITFKRLELHISEMMGQEVLWNRDNEIWTNPTHQGERESYQVIICFFFRRHKKRLMIIQWSFSFLPSFLSLIFVRTRKKKRAKNKSNLTLVEISKECMNT